METALHLTAECLSDISGIMFQPLYSMYEKHVDDTPGIDGAGFPDRIYIGDEFCLMRLPTLSELDTLLALAVRHCLPITFLTPVLTDSGINKCKLLFNRLNQRSASCEVVVNDLGVLLYLKDNYPRFHLSMGRLFNKGFKDPRLKADIPGIQRRLQALVNDSTFSHVAVQEMASALGVERFEQDLMPYADPGYTLSDRVETSVYFPFGYVTTGRACFIAGLGENPGAKFSYTGQCGTPCKKISVSMDNKKSNFKLFQIGNTVFYRYPNDRILSLLDSAKTEKIRLVYQGGLL